MKDEESSHDHNIFLYALLLGCAVAIASSFYFFYFKKQYDFVVEVACDPTVEICYQRDCTNADDCPPNQLSNFKRYSLSADDFDMCDYENCALACVDGRINCTPIECTEDIEVGESCSTLSTTPVGPEAL